MGANTSIKAGLYEAIAGLGFTTYTVNPQARDGGAPAAFPHVQIGMVTVSQWDTFSDNGHDFTARIYTRWVGNTEAPGLAIQDALYDRLHHGSINTDGFRLILLERQTSNVTTLQGSFEGLCEYHGIITTA